MTQTLSDKSRGFVLVLYGNTTQGGWRTDYVIHVRVTRGRLPERVSPVQLEWNGNRSVGIEFRVLVLYLKQQSFLFGLLVS